jgi:hypothetical protein
MPHFIQLIPVVTPEKLGPFAFYGLETGGRVWYGKVKEARGQNDGGPDAIAWRIVEDR